MVDALDHLACGECGLLVAPGRGGSYFHVEEPPEDWAPHDVTVITTRKEYLYGVAGSTPKPPSQRQAEALERIADAAERIVARLYQV
jgi:hypothetical protein